MEIKDIDFLYESGKKVLEGISFKVEKEKITTIIGANGCGKSTLFNVMSKNLKLQKGVVTLNGENIDKIPLKRYYGNCDKLFKPRHGNNRRRRNGQRRTG